MKQLSVEAIQAIPQTSFEECIKIAPPGLILEFGSAGGNSMRTIVDNANGRRCYGFDTFEGLPCDWEGYLNNEGQLMHPKGSFKGEPNFAWFKERNAFFLKGLFEDTLEPFLTDHQEPIGFIHFDADIYSSTAFVMERIHDRIQEGTIFCFDELWNYGGEISNNIWLQHEWKAFNEFLAATGYDATCLGAYGPFQVAFSLSVTPSV